MASPFTAANAGKVAAIVDPLHGAQIVNRRVSGADIRRQPGSRRITYRAHDTLPNADDIMNRTFVVDV